MRSSRKREPASPGGGLVFRHGTPEPRVLPLAQQPADDTSTPRLASARLSSFAVSFSDILVPRAWLLSPEYLNSPSPRPALLVNAGEVPLPGRDQTAGNHHESRVPPTQCRPPRNTLPGARLETRTPPTSPSCPYITFRSTRLAHVLRGSPMTPIAGPALGS